MTTRMMMLRARRELGEDMVVVDKRGGGGVMAMGHHPEQPADAHSILTFTIGHAAELAKGKTEMTLADVRPIARGTDDPRILMARCGEYESARAFVDAQMEEPLTYGTTHLCSIDDVSAFMMRFGWAPRTAWPGCAPTCAASRRCGRWSAENKT